MAEKNAAIACSLEQAELAERRHRWRRLGEHATVNVLTRETGLRLLFRAVPGIEGELQQLVELERNCCAFADWSVHTHGEELLLDVTAASEEGIAAVQAMFNDLHLVRPGTST